VLIRPQWQSWLARGAAVISLYGAVLAVHFLVGLGGQGRAAAWLAVAGLPLAVLTAVYTAYLLAQARGRDLWQIPLLPPHMAVQALVLGAAALAPLTAWLEPRALPPILILLAGACAAHLLLVAAEATLAHPTAHAELAAHHLFRGRLAPWLWGGAGLVLIAVFAPWLGPAATLPALLGLLAYEHGYVQAGQSVPLA
jgi:Ni/Fe-hydrogenase subunit HybB-like protein